MTRRRLPVLGTPLTEREKAVMAVVRLGKPNKLVAHALGVSEATIKVHIRNVMSKLGARTRTAAVVALFGEREEQVAEMQAEIDSLRSTLTRICILSKDGPISDLANAALEPDIWPAAGFVDTEIRCSTGLESGNATTEVQPRVQA